jgi:CO/xanthine dehydrogenase Mo-binding subunit
LDRLSTPTAPRPASACDSPWGTRIYSFNTHVGMVAEVSFTRPVVKVDRIVAAVDCGVAVNPDVVTAQIEGAIGFALSSVLRN